MLDNFDHSQDLKRDIAPFKLVKSLGEGGFGETFLFQDGKRKLVVKAIKKKYSNSSDTLNEIDVLKRLSQKCSKEHLLCFKSTMKYDDSTFILSEFINGMNLYDYSNKYFLNIPKNNIARMVNTMLSFINQSIKSLDYIHSLGIIHYDIKPENMMVSDKNNLKIIDFGGAKTSIDGKTIKNYNAHTQYYTPVDIKFKDSNPFSYGEYFDFYSLAVSFVEISQSIVSSVDKDTKLVKIIKLFHRIKYTNYRETIEIVKILLNQK